MRGIPNIRVAPTLSETVLRAAFIIVFGVTGFLLGREAYFSLFSPHFANEALQLSFLILSPVAGAIIGGGLTAPYYDFTFGYPTYRRPYGYPYVDYPYGIGYPYFGISYGYYRPLPRRGWR